jgi:hypothetical protein
MTTSARPHRNDLSTLLWLHNSVQAGVQVTHSRQRLIWPDNTNSIEGFDDQQSFDDLVPQRPRLDEGWES